MCFTPAVSLTTALFEFFIVVMILLLFRRSLVNKFFAVLLSLLGVYQLTEFMLCTTGQLIWAEIGFLVYSFLPAIGLHFIMCFTKRKFKFPLLYIPPLIFSAVALATSFVIQGECSTFFVVVRTLLTDHLNPAPTVIYSLYYFGYIALLSYFILKDAKKANPSRRRLDIIIFLAVLFSLLPALILLLILPSLGIMFPSVYCEFAVLFAVAAIIAAFVDRK
ncbi:MAG: hypothetical protein ISS93_02045 [Candidatus Aenigmarchaeota archaeon]|nr:hypothetical protein [Candidatus Aenigmarchaeota archaeon]